MTKKTPPADEGIGLFELIAQTTIPDHNLDEIVNGFSLERAREVLASAEKLQFLAEMSAYVAPGKKWLERAEEDSETGVANRQLLSVYLAARRGELDPHVLTVEVADEKLSLCPQWYSEDLTDELIAPVEVLGGTVTFNPGHITEPPKIDLESKDTIPEWVNSILGRSAVQRVIAGHERIEADYPEEWVEDLARYALGKWIKRWHPGSTQPNATFDDNLLNIELGALAWKLRNVIGEESAPELLNSCGNSIRQLAARIQDWTGWQRRLADGVLRSSCEAYLHTQDESEDVPQIRQLWNAMVDQDAVVSAALLDGLLADLQADGVESEVSLVAGETADGEEADTFGRQVVDPARVPARSVATWMQAPAAWIVVESERVQLRVSVAVGDSPVETLIAEINADGQSHEIDLFHVDGAYRGTLLLEDVPDHVSLEIYHRDYADVHRETDAVTIGMDFTQQVLDAREEFFNTSQMAERNIDPEDFFERPFLAELVVWDPKL